MQLEINTIDGQSESLFFDTLDISELSEMFIIAHTGRKLIERLIRKIELYVETEKFNSISIKILLKSPNSETQERSAQIIDTISKLNGLRSKGVNIDFRYYESLPFYRCVLCVLKNAEKKSMISNYIWLPQFKTMAFNYNFENGQNESGIYFDLAKSWFDHYWGNNEIHTLVFDFDDTVVKTFDIQVEAWCQTIMMLLGNNELDLYYCSAEINSHINDYYKLQLYVAKVFEEHQMAPRIFQQLFPLLDNERMKQRIEEIRFNERKKLTIEHAGLIENVDKTLRKLKQKYQLVIISATSETLIKEILQKHNIADCFSMILGKHGPKPDWENIYDKANLMIKLSKLVGIGLDRMAFIGDNDSDYRSARQIQVNFIECRVVANEEGINSMVHYLGASKPVFFDSYNDKQLEILLEEINRQCAEKKLLQTVIVPEVNKQSNHIIKKCQTDFQEIYHPE